MKKTEDSPLILWNPFAIMYFCMRLRFAFPCNAIGGGVTMPNIKSAKKRVLLTKVQNEKNKAAKSVLKTNLKKFDAALAEGNREQADSAYKAAVKTIDESVKKGILHKNNAARKKSSITRKLNQMA